jgi:hypothetical protein
MRNIWIIAAVIVTVVLLILYIRMERYEAPPPPAPAPQGTAELNPAIEELKAEILACGDDKTCVRKAMVNSMKKK